MAPAQRQGSQYCRSTTNGSEWRIQATTRRVIHLRNADGVSAAAQAKRINALAQIAGSVLANLEPLALLAGQPTRSSLELGLDSNPDTLTTFASMNVNDRRGSVDQSIGRSALLAIHALRTRQSDAGLRLSSASFSTRPRMLDAGLGLYEV